MIRWHDTSKQGLDSHPSINNHPPYFLLTCKKSYGLGTSPLLCYVLVLCAMCGICAIFSTCDGTSRTPIAWLYGKFSWKKKKICMLKNWEWSMVCVDTIRPEANHSWDVFFIDKVRGLTQSTVSAIFQLWVANVIGRLFVSFLIKSNFKDYELWHFIWIRDLLRNPNQLNMY